MNKICTNTKNYKLTQGKEYNIIDENDDYYYLVNDSNRTVKYDKSLFGDAQPVPVAVVPPPPPARTEQDCINSINVHPNGNVTFVDMDLVNKEMPNNLHVTTSAISCGVYQMTGISYLMAAILEVVNEDDGDLPLLIKSLFTKAIQAKVDVSNEHLFMLVSTNREDEYEDFYTTLDELSTFGSDWDENPNSNNQIKVWGLDIRQ
jgi:hypothetical protein